MTANRGSTFKLVAIKEATSGTTPSTPTMVELPVASFTPSFDQGVIRSNQIRSHPFVDKMMQGAFKASFGLDFELQAATHDMLLETMFGSTISAKSLSFVDALKTLTMEEQVGGGSSLFDQYTEAYLSSMEISAAGGDTSPVKVTCSGMSRTATLDASATIATSVTAAGNPDPFTFIGSTLKVAGTLTDVTTGKLTMTRKVDPLYVWGNADTREFIPSDVSVTGTITVPYDGAVQSTLFTAFADNAIEMKFGLPDASVFRKFTASLCKLQTLGRGISDRGVRTQDFSFEAKYDPATSTAIKMTTE